MRYYYCAVIVAGRACTTTSIIYVRSRSGEHERQSVQHRVNNVKELTTKKQETISDCTVCILARAYKANDSIDCNARNFTQKMMFFVRVLSMAVPLRSPTSPVMAHNHLVGRFRFLCFCT